MRKDIRICSKCGTVWLDSAMHKRGKIYCCPMCWNTPRTEAKLRAAKRRWKMEAEEAEE